MSAGGVKVSIIIKALNEEAFIADAICSALSAIEGISGEVILADSASTDRTVEIASQFPITIVQLSNPEERCCGIGPQLGYQHSRGEFVYILDGDMILRPKFMVAALAAMDADPTLGGVAGLVEQRSQASYQFRGLKRRRAEAQPGAARWLDMGGLYRRAALEEVGYISDRNLHAFEELELGMRLSARGWKLERLDLPSVEHQGYQLGSVALLWRRWKSGYLKGAGEVIRVSFGRSYLWRVLASQKNLLAGLAIWVALGFSLLLLPWSGWLLAAVLAATVLLVAIRAWRTRSLKDAVMGQIVWQVHSIAMVRGLLTAPVNPRIRIRSRVLAECAAGVDPRLPSDSGLGG